MMAKIVHTAKHTVNAIVDSQRARFAPGTVSLVISPPIAKPNETFGPRRSPP
jgi:hypothetical protein